ncbi:MAG: urease accessory protein UreD [Variibacter sp.]|nr:urease accessory protein UreD [Variibacter sp.]
MRERAGRCCEAPGGGLDVLPSRLDPGPAPGRAGLAPAGTRAGDAAPTLEGDAVFAANRVRAHVALAVAAEGGVTRPRRLREEGALRVRFPNAAPRALEAVLVNTAGGVAGGDRFGFDLALGLDAAVTVTTAAAEKVYRSPGAAARMAVRLTLSAGARLAWLPQETIVFEAARFERTIDVNLSEGARLVLAEAVVFGRAAMGETVETGRLVDRWRVRRAGRLVFADTLRLEGAIARKLGEAAIARGGIAMATVVMAPGGEGDVEAMRAVSGRLAGEMGVSSWNGLCVARLVAAAGAALRADMAVLLSALGVPVPRLWVM